MSDFIYSSITQNKHKLKAIMQHTSLSSVSNVLEYHGLWGSLAVGANRYHGFKPIENDKHIFVVIGGPVLYFTDNDFLTDGGSDIGTFKLYSRYLEGLLRWDEDLSGPFAIVIIDKVANQVTYVTDLLSFIPIHYYFADGTLFFGSHEDVLVEASGQQNAWDRVSLVDFILTRKVTFPHTVFQSVYQSEPAAVYEYQVQDGKAVSISEEHYWVPTAEQKYDSVHRASIDLRSGIEGYVNRVTNRMNAVAQFLSAGEDSRCVAAMIPRSLKRDGYIFLDAMNTEGRIANRIAEVFGVSLNVLYRDPNYYIEILPQATNLVGASYQYVNAHSIGFYKECGLEQYDAVFGGFLADTLLKGFYVGKRKSVDQRLVHRICDQAIETKLRERWDESLDRIESYGMARDSEWRSLWPITQHFDLSNLHATRRLFKSYEPFMCKEVVKIAAAVPEKWKLKRRLFQKAMKPYLCQSKWVPHPKNFLPCFPWWLNDRIGLIVKYQIARQYNSYCDKHNFQGPWTNWARLTHGAEFVKATENYTDTIQLLSKLTGSDISIIIRDNLLKPMQRLSLLQVLYALDFNRDKC